MSLQSAANIILIVIGAVVLLISILKTKTLMRAMPLVPQRQRTILKRQLNLHRYLMEFFLIGYVMVLLADILSYPLVTESFVSAIFFGGAIFAFTGIVIQSQLLTQVQTTLHGIVPICGHCKKIRMIGGESKDPKAWKEIESYISEKVDVDFSHGYCPSCFEKEMKKVQMLPRS
jgi:hypothetical protein